MRKARTYRRSGLCVLVPAGIAGYYGAGSCIAGLLGAGPPYAMASTSSAHSLSFSYSSSAHCASGYNSGGQPVRVLTRPKRARCSAEAAPMLWESVSITGANGAGLVGVFPVLCGMLQKWVKNWARVATQHKPCSYMERIPPKGRAHYL